MVRPAAGPVAAGSAGRLTSRYLCPVPSKPRRADPPGKPAPPAPAAAAGPAAKSATGSGPANVSRRVRAGLPSRAEQKRARLAEAEADLERKRRATRRRRLWIAAAVLAAVAALVLFDIFAIHHASKSKKRAAAIPSVAARTGTGRSSL
ncbi:MAG: hypothetical protein V7603_5860 [Micromonosporaceae bacterium]